jgi:GNAT superfamily N-acetyltransferase
VEPAEPVERVSYDAVDHLRRAWHEEDFPDMDSTRHHAQAREVALGRGAEVLALRRGGRPIAFAQIERVGDTAEITQVFVHADHRGHGLGTAITSAAITASADAGDLWICADDEDRPKHLYARLGFRGVARTIEFLRMP